MSKVYPKGIIVFNPNEKAPSFVKGTIVISPNQLTEWLEQNPDHVTDYKGEPQLKLQLLEGDKGLYVIVDTYKSKDKTPF